MSETSRSTFGKYVLLRKLASGGMGEVFLAKQRGPSGFEKLLVIKRILSHHLDKRDYLDMFFSEAKLVARLNHSNIIQIQEMGEIDGDYYIAMEYVRGKSLRDVIDELRAEGRTLPLPHVIDLAIKLCEGLGYAHQARDIRGRPMNIVHRDINPHNILVSYNGDLKLIDFGIAKSEMTSVHTATGTIKGKFVYMSPEQSAADPIDRRSDIFSLGIVLYEMTVLENPFVRQNVVLSLEAIQRQPIALPSEKRPDAAPLDAILARALEKRPEDRYQTAIDMRDDLRNLFRSGRVEAAEGDVSSFLHDLFRADIEEEDRLLAEADRATTPPGLASDPGLAVARAPRLLGEYASHTSDEVSASAVSHAAAYGDEEPTLSADYDAMARRSRAISTAGRQHEGGRDVSSAPLLSSVDEPLPESSTRSERIPRRASARASSVARGARPPVSIEPVMVPDARVAPDAISERGLGARLPVSGSLAMVPEPRPEPEAGSLPAAAFDEPLHGQFLPDPDGNGEVFAPFPSRTPPDRAFDRLGAMGHGAREESLDLVPRAPPPWRRAGYWFAGVALFLATTAVGYAVTRVFVPGGPRTDIARITPGSESSEAPALHPTPTPDPDVARVEAHADRAEPVKGAPSTLEARSAREPIEPIEGVTVRKPFDRKRHELAPHPRERPRVKPAEEPASAGARGKVSANSSAAPRPTSEPSAKPVSGDDEESPRGSADGRGSGPNASDVAEPSVRSEETEPSAREDGAQPRKPLVPSYSGSEAADTEARTAPNAKSHEDRVKGEGRLGTLMVTTSAEVSVDHESKAAGRSPAVLTLVNKKGAVTLTGPEGEFSVSLEYEVEDGGLAVRLDSNPWAIAKHNGLSLGRTPQRVVAGLRHRFFLLRPGQEEPFVIMLEWAPKGP